MLHAAQLGCNSIGYLINFMLVLTSMINSFLFLKGGANFQPNATPTNRLSSLFPNQNVSPQPSALFGIPPPAFQVMYKFIFSCRNCNYDIVGNEHRFTDYPCSTKTFASGNRPTNL